MHVYLQAQASVFLDWYRFSHHNSEFWASLSITTGHGIDCTWKWLLLLFIRTTKLAKLYKIIAMENEEDQGKGLK